MRLPNILGIEPRPFDVGTFEDDRGVDDEGGRTDNIIRWREDQDSGMLQSNARIVTWSDGSMTVHVGSEVLSAVPHKVEGGAHLFSRHKGNYLE